MKLSNDFPYGLIVDRQKELDQLHQLLQRELAVIIKGPAGAGKSTLARRYQELYMPEFHQCYLYMSLMDDTLAELRDSSWESDSRKPSLLVIDGFEKTFDGDDRKNLLKIFQDLPKYNMKIILPSGNVEELKHFEKFAAIMELQPLSEQEIFAVLDQLSEFHDLDVDARTRLMRFISRGKTNSAILQNVNDMLMFTDADKSLDLLQDKLSYHDDLQTGTQLITDARVVNEYLFDKIKNNPKMVYALHPRKFEEMVADMFTKMGYQVNLTPQTRDGGKDMYLIQHNAFGRSLYLVECKKHAPNRPVGVEIVRQLYGTVNAEKANAGIIVTSSYFSKPAINLTSTMQYQMSLVDYVKLCELIKSI